MNTDLHTVYGKISVSELQIPSIPCSKEQMLPNYFQKLFLPEIDNFSAPLEAVFEKTKVKIIPENFSALDSSAFLSVIGVKARGSKLTLLPKCVSPKLAYFIGYFLGDGSLKDAVKSRKKCKSFDHKLKVCDEFLCHVEFLQQLFYDLFGLILPIREERVEKGERLYYIEITNKPVYRFLTSVIGFPAGPKTSISSIPTIISSADIQTKQWFLKGLFDADGDTRAVEAGFNLAPRIKIRLKSKELIVIIKSIFEEAFGVRANGPYFEENSAYFQVEKYSSIISLSNQMLFLHPVKRWRLKKTADFLSARITRQSRS